MQKTILTAASACLILLLASPACAQSVNAAFEDLAESYIGDLSNFSPVSATLIGDHSADHLLDNVDAAARKKSRALYEEYKAALAEDNQPAEAMELASWSALARTILTRNEFLFVD